MRVLSEGAFADDQMRKMAKQWEAVQQRALSQYQLMLEPHVGIMTDAAEMYRGICQHLLQEQGRLRRAEALFARIPERLRKPLIAMANRGWYLDDEMSLEPVMSVETYIEEDPDGVDEQFCTYFGERRDGIEAALISEFPDRGALFTDAFLAHREQQYTLSIPVLLAQADGIWQQRLARGLFGKGGPRKAAKRYDKFITAGKFPEYRTCLVLWPLFESAPLWQTQSRRRQHFSGLNRHQIQLGESVSYGTETNGLKAVSFLSYVRSLLPPGEGEFN